MNRSETHGRPQRVPLSDFRASEGADFHSHFEPSDTFAKLPSRSRFLTEEVVLSDDDVDIRDLRTCPPSPELLAEVMVNETLQDWMHMDTTSEAYKPSMHSFGSAQMKPRAERSVRPFGPREHGDHRSSHFGEDLSTDPMNLGVDFASSAEHQYTTTPPPGTPNIPELAMPDILDHIDHVGHEKYPSMVPPMMNRRMRSPMHRRAPHPAAFPPAYPPFLDPHNQMACYEYIEAAAAARTRQMLAEWGVTNGMPGMNRQFGLGSNDWHSNDWNMQRSSNYKKLRHRPRNHKRAPPCPPDDPMDPLPTTRSVRVCTPNPTAALYEAQRRRTDLFPVKPLFQVMANKQFKAGRRVKRNITVLCKMHVKDKVLYKQKSAQTKNAAKTAAAISMLEKLRNLNVHITYVASCNKKQAKASGLMPEEPTPSESQMSQSSEPSSSNDMRTPPRSPTLEDAREKARQKLNQNGNMVQQKNRFFSDTP